MTPEELKIVEMLAFAWNAFTRLPVEHPSDNEEFCRMIHAAQEKVLARPARRKINDTK